MLLFKGQQDSLHFFIIIIIIIINIIIIIYLFILTCPFHILLAYMYKKIT